MKARQPWHSPLLTVREVAEFLHKRPETVYRYIADGLLPVVPPPPGRGGMRVWPEDLAAFVGKPQEAGR